MCFCRIGSRGVQLLTCPTDQMREFLMCVCVQYNGCEVKFDRNVKGHPQCLVSAHLYKWQLCCELLADR